MRIRSVWPFRLLLAFVCATFATLMILQFEESVDLSRPKASGPPPPSRIPHLPSSRLPSSSGTTGRPIGVFQAAITFSGRVIDQRGTPVPEATVEVLASDVISMRNSRSVLQTDANGLFSISGIRASEIVVSISKPGFLGMPDSGSVRGSTGTFGFGLDTGQGIHRPASSFPVVFHLYRQGPLEPLIRVGKKPLRIARDGKPLLISLDPDNPTSPHQVFLRSWCNDLDSRAPGESRYSWSLEISVPSGGILARNDPYAFEAPIGRYEQSSRIDMPQTLPLSEWSDRVVRSYFIRFNDNCYARVNIEMVSGGSHFVNWASDLNLNRGSRNLEGGL